MPLEIFPKANRASFVHALQSAARHSASPPPTTLPCTAATVGMGNIRSKVAIPLMSAISLSMPKSSDFENEKSNLPSFTEPPVQKCGPAPCSTKHVTFFCRASSVTSSRRARNALTSCGLSALKWSGSLSSNVATPSDEISSSTKFSSTGRLCAELFSVAIAILDSCKVEAGKCSLHKQRICELICLKREVNFSTSRTTSASCTITSTNSNLLLQQ